MELHKRCLYFLQYGKLLGTWIHLEWTRRSLLALSVLCKPLYTCFFQVIALYKYEFSSVVRILLHPPPKGLVFSFSTPLRTCILEMFLNWTNDYANILLMPAAKTV